MRNKDSQRTAFTNGQLALRDILEELGFITELEIEFSPYTLDIFCRNNWIACEFDGPTHWKKKDKKRDDYMLNKYGIPTLRIKSLAPKEKVKQEIIDFMWEWNDSMKERKAKMWEI